MLVDGGGPLSDMLRMSGAGKRDVIEQSKGARGKNRVEGGAKPADLQWTQMEVENLEITEVGDQRRDPKRLRCLRQVWRTRSRRKKQTERCEKNRLDDCETVRGKVTVEK